MATRGKRQSGQAPAPAPASSGPSRAASPAAGPAPAAGAPRPPWELARRDPPDLPAADFTLTAWVEARFPPDAAGVRCSLEWLAEPRAVDIGAVGSWQELPGGEGEAAAEGPRLARTRFERASPAQRGTCAFLRQLAEELLQVRVQLPPGAEPPAEEAAVALQLAPLLLPGPDGSPPEASAELGAAAKRLGLASLRVGVTCSGTTLSEEIAAHLNPMLLTLESASKLPCDDPAAAGARDRVYATVEAFGQQLRTGPCELGDAGKAEFGHQRVFFVGTWPAREFQAFLRANALKVAVHDRDTAAPPSQQAEKSEPLPPEPAQPAKAAQKRPSGVGKVPAGAGKPPSRPQSTTPDVLVGEQGGEAAAQAAAADERARDKEAQATGIYGLASIALGPLLGAGQRRPPRPGEPARFRSPLRPVVHGSGGRAPGEAPALPSSGVAELFGAGGREAVASREGRRSRVAPGYLEAGSAVALAVRRARPGLAPWAPLPEAASREAAAKAQHPSAEPFARAVVVHSCRDGALLKPLLALIADQNVAAMGLDPAQRDFLAGVALTEEQCSSHELDILTGFIATDRSQRVIVVEGLRDGAMQKVAGALEVGHVRGPGRRVLFSPAVSFDQRLYGKLGLTLKYIKLRQPELESLTVRPGLCLNVGRDGAPAACALHCLAEMRRAERLHALVNAFPPANAVVALETQYGTYVSDEELAGDTQATPSVRSRSAKGSKSSAVEAHRSSKGSTAPVAPPSCKVAAWTSSLRNPLSSTLPGQLVPLGGGEPMYSFSVSEPFREVPGSSAYLDAYMRDIARPVVLPALATSPRKKVSLSSMPMSARHERQVSWGTSAQPRGPLSARAR